MDLTVKLMLTEGIILIAVGLGLLVYLVRTVRRRR